MSESMVDTLTLAGPPDEVARRLAAYDGLATAIKLTPPTHGLSPEETRQAQARIIEMISGLSGVAA